MTKEEKLEEAKRLYKTANTDQKYVLESLFPELKESEDEKIKKSVLKAFKIFAEKQAYIGHCLDDIDWDKCIAWLENQGTPAALSKDEQNKLAKGILRRCAFSFINYLDSHRYEGKMDVSNGECEDIENAFQNAMWDRLHRYYCKYIEEQGEQSSLDCLKGIKRVQEYQDLSDWEKGFDDIASRYAYNKNQEGYNNSEYVKERAAEMLYCAKKELEKQGEQKPVDKIHLGKKYKCIASPRYSTFMIGEIYKPEDKFLCSLMNLCYNCFKPIEDGTEVCLE